MDVKKQQLRQQLEDYFRQEAAKENAKIIPDQKPASFEDFLDKNGNKRILIVVKESIGDIILATSLLESLKEQYSDYDLYFATEPQNFCLLEGNPYIYKCLQYIPQMDSEIWATGQNQHMGYFDKYIFIPIATQRFLNYLTHDKIALNLID